MDSLRDLERILYKPKSNDTHWYPCVNEDIFRYMELQFEIEQSHVLCFPFYVHTQARTYIDLYIWDLMLPGGYKRFVLETGYALKREEEMLFLAYLSGSIMADRDSYEHLVQCVCLNHQDIHLKEYQDFRHTLLHIYYTFHRAGPHEILFKANLNYFAAGLHKIHGCNLIGSSPEKILEVPLGMLRALNTETGVKLMAHAKDRKTASRLYAKYHNMIRNNQLNQYQWAYLKEQELSQNEADRQMFLFLGRITCDDQYYKYLHYIEQKGVVDGYYSLLSRYPDKEQWEESLEVCDTIAWYIEHEYGINYSLKEKAWANKEKYFFDTGDYIVYMPTSLDEILSESQNQHNCLHQYVLEMACRDTIILFMREKGKEQASFVTIEVDEDEIIQAYGAYNRPLAKKEWLFLEQYACEKQLKCMIND